MIKHFYYESTLSVQSELRIQVACGINGNFPQKYSTSYLAKLDVS